MGSPVHGRPRTGALTLKASMTAAALPLLILGAAIGAASRHHHHHHYARQQQGLMQTHSSGQQGRAGIDVERLGGVRALLDATSDMQQRHELNTPPDAMAALGSAAPWGGPPEPAGQSASALLSTAQLLPSAPVSLEWNYTMPVEHHACGAVQCSGAVQCKTGAAAAGRRG